jgi:hypothetical protein
MFEHLFDLTGVGVDSTSVHVDTEGDITTQKKERTRPLLLNV